MILPQAVIKIVHLMNNSPKVMGQLHLINNALNYNDRHTDGVACEGACRVVMCA